MVQEKINFDEVESIPVSKERGFFYAGVHYRPR